MGKWVSDGDDQNYISFSRVSYNINKKESKSSGKKGVDNKISISFSGGEGDDVIDTGDYVIENGDTTIFKDTVKLQFEEIIEEKVEAIDIMVLLDISGSMESTDFLPNRLESAKSHATSFVRGRPQDRMGLILFASDAFFKRFRKTCKS